ncbi:heme peroxidase [Cynara cardunculus var. scolymus]|uniref:Heme peroxidase n=1 Tax=Cynara cardunculus var. scolymus TaxID=59895 RepID=A0A118JYX4_CYNCS|nr:heme peroxidase [Cynara cardunculus var. scolymus]
MGFVSFLSTLPTLLPIAPLPSYNSSKCPIHSGTISCKIDDGGSNEKSVRRRDILNCFGAAISMELVASSTQTPSPFVEVANAADLIQRRQRSEFQSSIKTTLYTAIKANQELIPSILTSEISRPENKGLSAALSLVEDAKKEIDSYSKAQSALKATFLASAIRKCGGNEEKGNLLYSAYGSSGQWGLFDRQFGRSDAQEPDPEGRVLDWAKASVQEMKEKFIAIGFGPRQLAVMSAFLGPDQLATEAMLAMDPDVTKWVEKYQRSRETVSETDYEVDLITTLTKMSCLGQTINYEAYSYPVQKLDFSKLKL